MPKNTWSGHPELYEQETKSIEGIGQGSVFPFLVGLHEADRAGKHYDVRLGTPETGLLSWATRKELPENPGESIRLIPQPVHSWEYQFFSGEIPKGHYGAGFVHPVQAHQALALDVHSAGITFSFSSAKGLRRYKIQKTKDGKWYLTDVTPNPNLPKKQHYKLIDENKARELLQLVGQKIVSVQPKIDGAMGIIRIGKDSIDIFSPRTSVRSGAPIPYTEKIFGVRSKVEIPPNLRDSILLGEIYAVRRRSDGTEEVLKPHELSAILNSNLHNALQKIKDSNIQFRVFVFDAVKLGKDDVMDENTWYQRDYNTRRAFINTAIRYLPSTFHAPLEFNSKQSAEQLLNDIKKRMYALTSEGIVLYPERGLPYKYKTFQEKDYYIVGYEPGEGKYKNRGIGALVISDKPYGKPIGAVGSGLTDELREMFYKNPDLYLGRKIRVKLLDEYESGALRKPVFIALHEG